MRDLTTKSYEKRERRVRWARRRAAREVVAHVWSTRIVPPKLREAGLGSSLTRPKRKV